MSMKKQFFSPSLVAVILMSTSCYTKASEPILIDQTYLLNSYINVDDLKLVVQGKPFVYVVTKSPYVVAQPDGAAYAVNKDIVDCNRSIVTPISWQTFSSDGVPLRLQEYNSLDAAIEETFKRAASPQQSYVTGGSKLCGIVSRWVYERLKLADGLTIVKSEKNAGRQSIPLTMSGGVYELQATINSAMKLSFVVDSGAADVTLPQYIGKTLFASGLLTKADILGSAKYILADGSSQTGIVVNLKSLAIGDIIIRNVKASIMPVDGAALLLGQSALKKLGKWRIDSAAGRFEIVGN